LARRSLVAPRSKEREPLHGVKSQSPVAAGPSWPYDFGHCGRPTMGEVRRGILETVSMGYLSRMQTWGTPKPVLHLLAPKRRLG
jgi:hypothetical protein